MKALGFSRVWAAPPTPPKKQQVPKLDLKPAPATKPKPARGRVAPEPHAWRVLVECSSKGGHDVERVGVHFRRLQTLARAGRAPPPVFAPAFTTTT